ncbi:MAG TPA: hypothetical protein VFP54_01885 [Acidimicrobiales bacterium]|nr:hypothetical protein [Acidimicrobiales bacterium]
MSVNERDFAELATIVKDLAEDVARLTHDEDYLAGPEVRAEAEQLARAAARLARRSEQA